MNYKNEYENLKQKLFLAVRKKQGKYFFLKKNGRKADIIRNIISELDLDLEYYDWLKARWNKKSIEEEKMKDLKQYSTAQLLEELHSRADEVVVCSEPIEDVHYCVVRGKALHKAIPAGYELLAVKAV